MQPGVLEHEVQNGADGRERAHCVRFSGRNSGAACWNGLWGLVFERIRFCAQKSCDEGWHSIRKCHPLCCLKKPLSELTVFCAVL